MIEGRRGRERGGCVKRNAWKEKGREKAECELAVHVE